MAKVKPETKLCKHCKTEIPYEAKVCPNCRKKQGGALKWILIVALVLIIIGAMAGGGSNEESDSAETATAETVQEEEPDSAEVESEDAAGSEEENENSEYITMEEFEQIETGMTYEEVVEIIGGEGVLSSESEISGYKTSIYVWYGDLLHASNANVEFMNGEVMSKAQIGLD